MANNGIDYRNGVT